jgi:cytochrome c2
MLYINELTQSVEGYCYDIKDALKKAGCSWQATMKKWVITDKNNIPKVKMLLDEVNKNNDDHVKYCWSRSLQHHHLERVCKQDENYGAVHATFMLYLKDK